MLPALYSAFLMISNGYLINNYQSIDKKIIKAEGTQIIIKKVINKVIDILKSWVPNFIIRS